MWLGKQQVFIKKEELKVVYLFKINHDHVICQKGTLSREKVVLNDYRSHETKRTSWWQTFWNKVIVWSCFLDFLYASTYYIVRSDH